MLDEIVRVIGFEVSVLHVKVPDNITNKILCTVSAALDKVN